MPTSCLKSNSGNSMIGAEGTIPRIALIFVIGIGFNHLGFFNLFRGTVVTVLLGYSIKFKH